MSSSETSNKGKIWGMAAVAGVLAFIALKLLASYTFMPALLLAILIGILVAILLWIGFYRDSDDESATGSIAAGSDTAATIASSTPEAAATSVTSPKPTAVATKPPAKSTAVTKTEPAAKPKAATKPKAAAKPKTAAKKTAAKSSTTTRKATTKAKPATKAKASGAAAKSTASSIMGEAGTAMVSEKKAEKTKSAVKPVAKDGKPPLLKKARAAGADDLKKIKGVGPGLEKTLNELGFYHFDQVAGWRKKEVEWVDSRLKFKGRIERDGWVKQAKTLAKGG